jgi:hypothetical protein
VYLNNGEFCMLLHNGNCVCSFITGELCSYISGNFICSNITGNSLCNYITEK